MSPLFCTYSCANSACFLLDHLQAVQPVEYHGMLAQLLARARAQNDAAVLCDPYRQIRAIVELNAELHHKNQ